MSGITWWTSRNSKGRWSTRNYRYAVGQRVLLAEGSQNGIDFGTLGTVTKLPESPHDYIEVLRDGEDTPGGWSPGANVIPLRKHAENAARVLRKRVKRYTDQLAQMDELGRIEREAPR